MDELILADKEPENYSIFLKGIDTQTLSEDYREGKYSHLGIPGVKVNFTNNSKTQLYLSGNNPYTDKIYHITSAFHSGETYVTTNCERFKTFYLTGKEAVGGKCHYCGRTYNWAYFGWPKKVWTEKNKLLVQLDYDSCGFNCLDAELEILQYHPLYRDEALKVRENMLKLFQILFPGQTIEPMPFYKLLTTWGGSIDPDNVNLTAFVPTDEIISAPIKTVFAARKKSTKENSMIEK